MARARGAAAEAAAAPSTPGSAQKQAKKSPRKAQPAAEATPQRLSKAARIASQLAQLFPDPPIPLDHGSPFQLLVAVMLSAQTTDKKVNEVTPALFALAPDAAAMASQPVPAVQAIIQPIGLAPTKARNLVAMAGLLLERHGGQVPASFAELEALPGVGHKTASVVMAQAHGAPALPVDTHVHRLAARWGLSSGSTVEQTEADLKALLPQALWHDVHLQMIFFGRQYCPAKQHDSAACPICSWAAVPAAKQPPAAGGKPAAAAGSKSKQAGGKLKRAGGAAVPLTAAPAAGDGGGGGAGGAAASKRQRRRR